MTPKARRIKRELEDGEYNELAVDALNVTAERLAADIERPNGVPRCPECGACGAPLFGEPGVIHCTSCGAQYR